MQGTLDRLGVPAVPMRLTLTTFLTIDGVMQHPEARTRTAAAEHGGRQGPTSFLLLVDGAILTAYSSLSTG